MSSNWIQKGETIQLVAPYAVSHNGGALVGATFGIAQSDVASGDIGQFELEGVWTLPKATGASTGGAQGARAYWNNTNKNVTAVSTSNTLIGVFTATCADGDATCVVRLNGSF